MATSDAEAMAIFQDALDNVAAATLQEDPDDRLKLCVGLPYRRIFTNREVLVETEQDMLEDFTTRGASLRAAGVNQLIILASSAEYLGPDYISGYRVSHALRNGIPVMDSIEGRAVLHRQEAGNWAFVEIETNAAINGFPAALLHVSRRPVPANAPKDDARRLPMDAVSIYQRYLDKTAEAVARDDFDAYTDLMLFPYTAHSSTLDTTIEGPSQLRPFFNVLRRCHDGTVGDDISRIADRAEFVGADLICGYHTGTVYKAGVVTVDPVHSRMILKRIGAVWRLSSVSNSIDNTAYPFSMYNPGGILRTDLEVGKRLGKTRAGTTNPSTKSKSLS